MAQRVAIAMALICSPKLVISDDATSGLDVTVQAQVLELLRRLVGKKERRPPFITRDIAITAHFCSRIAIIYAGQIVEFAETIAFFKRPAHPYSIMLLAAFSHSPELRARWNSCSRRGRNGARGRLRLRAAVCAPPEALPRRGAGLPSACRWALRSLPFSSRNGCGMSALLEVQNLEKQFPIAGSRKVVQAVNGVDFTIESGKTLALVGESGSGKTTIGRAVVGLIEATAGEIRFDGKKMGTGPRHPLERYPRPHSTGVPGAGGIARPTYPCRRDHGRTLALPGNVAPRPRGARARPSPRGWVSGRTRSTNSPLS